MAKKSVSCQYVAQLDNLQRATFCSGSARSKKHVEGEAGERVWRQVNGNSSCNQQLAKGSFSSLSGKQRQLHVSVPLSLRLSLSLCVRKCMCVGQVCVSLLV